MSLYCLRYRPVTILWASVTDRYRFSSKITQRYITVTLPLPYRYRTVTLPLPDRYRTVTDRYRPLPLPLPTVTVTVTVTNRY